MHTNTGAYATKLVRLITLPLYSTNACMNFRAAFSTWDSEASDSIQFAIGSNRLRGLEQFIHCAITTHLTVGCDAARLNRILGSTMRVQMSTSTLFKRQVRIA